jgi:hypothetical protein
MYQGAASAPLDLRKQDMYGGFRVRLRARRAGRAQGQFRRRLRRAVLVPARLGGGSPVTGYHVYLGLSKSLVGARQFTTSGTSFRLTDAENGSLYYVMVAALNAAGEGPGTPETSVFVAPHVTASPSGPSRPTGLTAQAHRADRPGPPG